MLEESSFSNLWPDMVKKKDDIKIILGIDPGTLIMGYGLIRIVGKKPEFLTMGVLKLTKIQDPFQKLGEIYKKLKV